MIKRLSLRVCAASCLAATSLFAGSVHAQTTASGKYTASALQASWRIGDWGAACGPKPSGGGEAGGSVTVTDDGKTLTLSGLGRTYRSNQCWEQLPGLTTQSSSGGGSTYRAVCKNAPGDPRQATITTTWTVRPNALYFDETGQYQFVVENQNCTASVRRTRVLTRVEEKAAEPVTPPAPTPAPTPVKPQPPAPAEPPPSRCQKPGPARRLEVSPAEKLMLPGERFSFRTVVRDDAGCVVKAQPTWAIERGQELGRLVSPGTLETNAQAVDGAIGLRATLDGQSVQLTAQVVSRERYEALLAAGTYGESGESKESAVTLLAGSTIDAEAQVLEGKTSIWTWIIAAVSGLLFLGAAGWLVFGRKKPQALPVEEPEEAPPAAPPPPPEPNKVCPLCGEQYPPTAEFCGKDGAFLLRMN